MNPQVTNEVALGKTYSDDVIGQASDPGVRPIPVPRRERLVGPQSAIGRFEGCFYASPDRRHVGPGRSSHVIWLIQERTAQSLTSGVGCLQTTLGSHPKRPLPGQLGLPPHR